MSRNIIIGTGAYIPEVVRKNEDFIPSVFLNEDGGAINKTSGQIIENFKKITGIAERRYAGSGMNASEMAALAAKDAIDDSGIDKEQIDQIIVAHNYGDLKPGTFQPDTVPSLASRVKHKLGINNPNCIAYDILFGCPGWLQALIQADCFIKANNGTTFLVIGTETLSRIIDPFDRDSMIFADGAGACILQKKEGNGRDMGILSTAARSDCNEEVSYINLGTSYDADRTCETGYIKMQGRKVYEYALKNVPAAMKDCLEKSGASIHDLKKIFIHQANEKMDEAILKSFYQLFGIDQAPADIMPMSIQWLGNSSVATIPTLLHLVNKGLIKGHSLSSGDLIMFASVGAGMNINAVCYRW
ncbi:ketoacyl-ACP synthase III [Pseudoflavitalea sp. G-6-1-2]|uniref:3-oxoacyl-ACP synthase III family protein n=1 Tax=Pseudoflavitalea sp. G-6-1-2 TaxID=2728841 RepID=UPI00146BD197|nr:ketoacyl-ACP synthase III [Pseudoflavitalea sp. G-6-1-2]NML21195.1 ketoacyl-ACP synthase III [Pseudoflavitalea sp. G-6-1-2]